MLCYSQFCGGFEIDFCHASSTVDEKACYLNSGLSAKPSILQLELSLSLRLLFVLYSDGKLVLCSISKKGLKHAELIKFENWVGSGDAVCASLASEQQLLAVGTRRGVVELYDLAESASLLRSVSLYDWG